MGDGKDKPKLQPPPRVPAPDRPDPGAGSNNRPDPTAFTRPAVRGAVIAAMVLGLIGVFVLLPQWQEKRQNQLTDTGPTTGPDPRPVATATSAPAAALPIDEVSVLPTAFPPTATSVPIDIPAPPKNTPRPRQTTEDRQFVEAMSDGLAALENRQWLAAQDAFSRASRLRPDAPEVADGLARARAGQRRESVADSLRRARGFEENEAWHEAEKMYSAVLAIDPESAPALDGAKRTKTRADLDEKLEFHLANPGRLATRTVFEDAASALEEALETVPSGKRLERQIASLEAVLERASTPVAVVLESDDSTEVVVYQVGRLGTFMRRELNLRPGAYTVVGSRPGYRDVRLRLVVTPGTPPKPLVIRCTERL